MKHVFVLHSHTTLLTALGTVEYLCLDKVDIIFLLGRNYRADAIDIPYTSYCIDRLYSQEISYNGHTYIEKKKAIQEHDDMVNTLIRDEYICYVPNLCIPFFMLLYTNSKCKELRYIQESSIIAPKLFDTSYKYKDLVRYIFKDRRFFMSPIRTWLPCCVYRSHILYKQNKILSFSYNKKYFCGLPSENHLINLPKIEISYDLDETAAIFIADGVVKNKMVEVEIYYEAINKLVIKYHRFHNYVKFHPNESSEERAYILNLFKHHNVCCDVLPDGVPLELLLMSKKNLRIIGLTSSLCYFAKDYGHDVVCHEDWILKKSKLYNRFVMNGGTLSYQEIYEHE